MYSAITHKLDAIDSLVILYEVVDVTIVHPLRNDREYVPFQVHTDKRKDVQML